MTAKELATALTGRKVGMEITSVEFDRAADAGLVVVFGYSDDNVEFRGAIDEEVGAWNGTTIHVTPDGLLEPPACSDDVEDCTCPYFAAAKKRAKIINALWHDKGGPTIVSAAKIFSLSSSVSFPCSSMLPSTCSFFSSRFLK